MNNNESELKTRITAFLILLMALLVTFGGFLAFFRDYYTMTDKDRKIPDVPQDIVLKWKHAVSTGNASDAITYAAQIVPDSEFQLPKEIYLDFFDSCGQLPQTLTSTWNQNDFERWAAWLKNSRRIKPLQNMDQVLSEIQNAPHTEIFDIAALYGFDGFAVRVLNSEKPLELYEFRKDGKVFTMFPSDRKMSKGSVKSLMPADAKLIHLYPARMADYRRSNQMLYRRVEPYVGKMPKPPAATLIELKQKYPDINAAAFWPTPIRPNITVRGSSAVPPENK